MGACNKLQISLRLWALEQFFCSRLFLDLWICVDRLRLCKCIVDRLYGYFWIYESVLTLDKLCECIVDRLYNVNRLFLDLWICDMCILMRIIEALKQVMNLWQVMIYESAICVFLDLWICNRLWFFFFFFIWWISYNVYFWIYVVKQKQVMKNVKRKAGCDFFLIVKCLMDV